jgi:predicted transcriptional regulator of viral defense system
MKQRLGKLETQFFAYIQMRRLRTVRSGDIASPLKLTSDQERKLLSRLAKAGMITRVQRGLYLVPERLPLGGKWSPDGISVINMLMEEKQGRYQICGPNAFNRYGFDEQVPVRIYAYNSAISGDRNFGAVALSLIKVDLSRLGDTDEFRTAEGVTAIYSSRTRTLLDAVYDWSRFNSLPRAYEWIRNELRAARIDVRKLIDVTLRYGDTGTIRRIGILLDREGVEERLLRRLEKALKPSAGLIPWIPTKPKRGKINRRWGVVFNEEP